MQLLQK